ncbi:MAG: HEAT repeat domain-containing protein [Planctomycetota bacterium]|jgi:HEAT repeat protein
MRPAFLLLAPALLCASLGAQGISLAEVPELSRKLLAAQKERMLANLEPYMEDLHLDGGSVENYRYLDEKFDEIVAMGESVIPILLEYLSPEDESGEKRALASNAARILGRMQPKNFVAELIAITEGRDPIARGHAIDLLGESGDPAAADAIVAIFEKLRGDPLRRALRALSKLETDAAAQLAVRHLKSKDASLRRRVLAYLLSCKATVVMDAVLAAFPQETVADLLPLYIRYFSEVVHANNAVAEALLPKLRSIELDRRDQRFLARALGHIAAPEHAPSITALMAILEEDDAYDQLGVAAALSLRDLGEDKGERILTKRLDNRVRRARSSSSVYADRGLALLAFGDWRKAKRDYEQAIKHARGNTQRSMYQLQLARCEAHLGKTRPFVTALRNSGITLERILSEAANDPAFAQALEEQEAQRYLASLREKRK